MQNTFSYDYSKLDDDALLRLIVLKRSEALGAFYDRYNRLVFSLAYHIVGDRETAEEITQDVFHKVWENAPGYNPGLAKPTTWMTSITRYRAIDILRKRRVRPEKDSVEWGEAALFAFPDATDPPEELAELQMQKQRIREAVAGLPSDQRAALALSYFHGLSHSEIAERLDLPLGTVKTRIRLAMQRLREQLLGGESVGEEIHE